MPSQSNDYAERFPEDDCPKLLAKELEEARERARDALNDVALLSVALRKATAKSEHPTPRHSLLASHC